MYGNSHCGCTEATSKLSRLHYNDTEPHGATVRRDTCTLPTVATIAHGRQLYQNNPRAGHCSENRPDPHYRIFRLRIHDGLVQNQRRSSFPSLFRAALLRSDVFIATRSEHVDVRAIGLFGRIACCLFISHRLGPATINPSAAGTSLCDDQSHDPIWQA